MRREHRIAILLTLICLALFGLWTEHKMLSAGRLLLVQSERNEYHAGYSDFSGLLTSYEMDDWHTAIRNPSLRLVRIDDPLLFLTEETIRQEIGATVDDSEEERAGKIFDFVEAYYSFSHPLYLSYVMHHPMFFFSVFGKGFCDDAAINMAYLGYMYGFEARTWWLDGHGVAELKYDGKWHVYDPDQLGIVRYQGEVASLDTLVLLAKEGKLPRFNEIIASTENNIPRTDVFWSPGPGSPYLELYGNEKRLFFDKLYMLSTDANFPVERFSTTQEFLSHYAGIGNYIREIPLADLFQDEQTAVVEDYFPMVAAFVVIPGGDSDLRETCMPEARLDTIRLKQEYWITAKPWHDESLRNTYLDLTVAFKAWELTPSYRLVMRNLGHLLHRHQDAKLLTVHFYSFDNARFDSDAMAQLKGKGLLWSGRDETGFNNS